jgi:predicted dienelactone hydrolase
LLYFDSASITKTCIAILIELMSWRFLKQFHQTGRKHYHKHYRKLYQFAVQALIGITLIVLTSLPAKATDRVYFSYGILERSVSAASLTAYAKDGTVNSDLAFFLQFLDPETRAEFRTALTTLHQLSPVAVAQIFYEPMGEKAIGYLGNLIQTGKRQNGRYALRAALILAAAKPGGFTLLDVLHQFPTSGLRIDLKVALQALRRGEAFVQETNAVIAGIEQLARQSETETSLQPTDIPDLRQPGPFRFSQQTMVLHDPSRNRTYPADLYLPQTTATAPASIPVVVISHGLGSSRADFSDIAEYFATYGYAVALPEHIGSDYALQQAVLAGSASEVFRVSEFVDRPLDVRFLLDQLEQRNAAEWQGRLNLSRVAVGGHSFGGYTVLALAGATVDFDHLSQDCSRKSFSEFLDPAVLLQCRALESSAEAKQQLTQGLNDERVGLVIAFNPVDASIFGPKGLSQIQVPIVMGASGYDPAAPLVTEQAYSFTWLTAPEKYLLLARGGAHIPQLTALINRMLSPTIDQQQLAEAIALFRSNVKALLLAFLQVYLANRSEYESYLQPYQVRTLGDPPFSFSLIHSLSPEQLAQMLRHGNEASSATDLKSN